MSQNNIKQSNHKKINTSFSFYLLPIIFTITIIPLIVRSHTFDTKLSSYPWFSSESTINDIFLYHKSLLFTIITLLIACLLIRKIYVDRNKIKFSPIFVPLVIYAILSLLSSVFSMYSYFSFHGIYEQFESIWVITGYCLIAFYAFTYVNTEDDINTILKWLFIGVSIIVMIGLSQVAFHDFYKTTIGKMTILPFSQWNALDTFDFKFELGRVYSSLYNPNYVGTYVGLIMPLLLVLTLSSKNKKMSIYYIALILGLLVCLFGSQSRSGLIAIIVSLLLMAILYRKLIYKQKKILFLSIFICIAISFFILHIMNNNLITRITNMFNTTTIEPNLSEIQTNDDNVTIVYKNEPLIINFTLSNDNTSYQFILTDTNGDIVSSQISTDYNSYVINDKRFPGFTLSGVQLTEVIIGFRINIDQKDWYFTNQTDGTYYYFTGTGKLDKIKNSPTSNIINPTFASNRGYIWSKTIPLLKNSLLLGTGADTFSLVYPNNDYVQKYNYGYDNSIITKPHNMFLQIGVQTGVISLLAFIFFYLMYFISSLKLYISQPLDTNLSHIGVAILAGTISYMVSGLTNDSTITVAPIFWVLIGIGISINYRILMLKNSNKAI